MSERTCPFDRRNPPSWYRPCPDCGATRFDPCPVKAAADAAARDRLAADNARLREALTPSAETKAAYMGEFSFLVDDTDEDGWSLSREVAVPWTTIKEIMAHIHARALLETPDA